MAKHPSSLRLKIILPLTLLILGAMVILQGAVIILTMRLSEEYHDLIAKGHARQVENIVANAMSELVLGQLLNQPMVVEAKKKATLEEISVYWRENDLEGQVKSQGVVLRSSPFINLYAAHLERAPVEGIFHLYKGLDYVKGAVTRITAWDWTVVTLSKPVSIVIQPTTAAWFLPTVVLTFLLLLGAVQVFLRHSLAAPVDMVLADIRTGGEISPTGIEEIDRIGSTVNHSLGDLRQRNEQMKLLHDAAILLNRSGQTRQVLESLLAAANRLLGASHGAVVVFPTGSNEPSLVLRKGDCQDMATMPHCVLLWQGVLRRDLGVLINRPADDGEFGLLCSECCVQIRNIIGWGIRSAAQPGRDLVMVFANKEGGFSEEDQRMVRILAADVMETIGRLEAENSLRGALEEKKVLLKEVHHRVKNNLQVISGLLTLQAAHLPEGEVRSVFRESQDRIITMALIHEKLYETDDLSRIEFAGYLESLLKGLAASYGARERDIDIRKEIDPVLLVVDTAIPSALIINELVSNSLKHAFPDGRKGTVTVSFARNGDGTFRLQVADDGVGLPTGMDPLKGATLGLKLISILGSQLGGKWEIGEGPGTSWRLTFREYFEAGTNLV